MTDQFGPVQRPDSKPLHPNAIRRFREELRLDRPSFADLLDVNLDTLRVWETEGKSRPRGQAALKIIEIATHNHYPMSINDIYPTKKKKPNGRSS